MKHQLSFFEYTKAYKALKTLAQLEFKNYSYIYNSLFANLLFSFFCAKFGIFGCLFAGISLVHGIVFFKLHSLHFLLDGLHDDVKDKALDAI